MKDKQILSKYLSESCVDNVYKWFRQHHASLKITSGRSTKLGDYRPPHNGLPHRITVNHNLNKHEFVITLVHEMAHLLCFKKHGRGVKPHGNEWKLVYRDLFPEICPPGILPGDVEQSIQTFFHPQTSYRQGNEVLKEALRKYDSGPENITVEDIPDGGDFIFGQRIFRRVSKLRKRYKCMCLENKRLYSFGAMAVVVPVPTK
jgi:hypothetical protein